MTSRANLRDQITNLTEENAHKDRLHKALLTGWDAICKERDGSRLAADMIAADADQLDRKIRTVRQYAENLLTSGSSAYRKAGTRLLEILDAQPEQQEQEAAS